MLITTATVVGQALLLVATTPMVTFSGLGATAGVQQQVGHAAGAGAKMSASKDGTAVVVTTSGSLLAEDKRRQCQ